jgi:hypothetical protein
VRRLPANRRPAHKVTLGLAEGAISRSPAEPSQALKPKRMTDSCMTDIPGAGRRHDDALPGHRTHDSHRQLRYRSAHAADRRSETLL